MSSIARWLGRAGEGPNQTTNEDTVPVGEAFLDHSVQTWRLIRQRNIDNAARAKVLEDQTAQVIDNFQRQHQSYSALQSSLDRLPEMHRHVMAMTQAVEAIVNKTSRLEIALDLVLKERDRAKLAGIEREKENELAAMRVAKEREYVTTKRNIEVERERRVAKEINARREAYEAQLRQAIQTFTTQAVTAQITSPIAAAGAPTPTIANRTSSSPTGKASNAKNDESPDSTTSGAPQVSSAGPEPNENPTATAMSEHKSEETTSQSREADPAKTE